MRIKLHLSMLLLFCVVLLGVTGCDSRFKAEVTLTKYVTDLSRSQFFSLSAPAPVMPMGLPSLRDRQQTLTQFDIGLLDFLSLQQCDVGAVAGRKNSILGKVMPDSQRFLYELDIIRAIESCDIKSDDLSEELQLVAKTKQLELPKAFSNAIFNGAESDAFFSLSNGYLPLDYSTAQQQDLLDALSRLVVIGEALPRLPIVDGEQFEEDLKILMNSEFAGKLLYSLVQITANLNAVANQVGSLEGVCGAPLTYLKQQFEVNYVETIQPYMGRIQGGAYQVLPLLNKLINLTAPHSDAMSAFLAQFSLTTSDSVWAEYQQASQWHAKSWNNLFSACSVTIRPS